MSKFVKFPSIDQFRNAVKWANSHAKYHNIALEPIAFTGTVKLHGTNASVTRTIEQGELCFGSRERQITPLDDNAGFAKWGEQNAVALNALFDRIAASIAPHYPGDTIIQVVGEWCGGNVQKGVGLNQLPKMFVVFGIRVVEIDPNQPAETGPHYKNVWFRRPFVEAFTAPFTGDDFFNIYQFPTWEVVVDFNRPDLAQNQFVELTIAVEEKCPVAAQLLGDRAVEPLIGEGLVWTPSGDPTKTFVDVGGLRFKTKGEKHSASKVKTIAEVDVEKMNSLHEFVDATCTENRLAQGLDKLREKGLEVDTKNTGEFIKWVVGDVIKEEGDTMEASGLSTKDVTSTIANKARKYFLEQVNRF